MEIHAERDSELGGTLHDEFGVGGVVRGDEDWSAHPTIFAYDGDRGESRQATTAEHP